MAEHDELPPVEDPVEVAQHVVAEIALERLGRGQKLANTSPCLQVTGRRCNPFCCGSKSAGMPP